MRRRAIPVALAESRLAHTLRGWLLVVILCDIALLIAGIARYPAYFAMPGAMVYLVEPVFSLVIYAAWCIVLPPIAARLPHSSVALRVGVIIGLISGAIEVLSTALESLFTLPQSVVSVTTGAAMLALFLLFGVAGFLAGRRTRSFWLGVGAAV